MGGAAGSSAAAGAAGGERWLIRNDETEAALQSPDSNIGGGTRACVLFSQPTFDTAAVVLAPNGGEMAETNTSGNAMLYYVYEGEDGQVELNLSGHADPQRVSKGSEVLIPAGVKYVLKNHSRRTPAKLITVVPR